MTTENKTLELAQKFGLEFLTARLVDEKLMLKKWKREFDSVPDNDTPENSELIDVCLVEITRWKKAILWTGTLIGELEKAEQEIV